MSQRINEDVLGLLLNKLSISGNSIRITCDLSREEYLKVDDVLSRLGGIWNKKEKCHIFQINPKPLLDFVLESKEIPDKNPTAFFPTPKKLVNEMIHISELKDLYDKDNLRILEPSAGNLAIASVINEICPNAQLDLVEILPMNQEYIRSQGFEPICCDFVEYNTDYLIEYDYVFMNPPFSVESDAKVYMTHIYHAHKMLKYSGTLIAIVPTGFLTNDSKRDEDFYNFVATYGLVYENPKDSFAESGTKVDTVTLQLTKSDWKIKEKYQSSNNYFEWLFYMAAFNNNYELAKEGSKLCYESKRMPSDEVLKNFCIKVIKESKDMIHKGFLNKYIQLLKNEFITEQEFNNNSILECDDLDIEIETVDSFVPVKSSELSVVPMVKQGSYTQLSLF